MTRLITRIKQHIPVWLTDPAFLTALLLLVGFLLQFFYFQKSLEDLQESGELVVVSYESPTTWYQDGNQSAGPEYDYLTSFAEFLGVKLRLDIRDNSQAVITDITSGEGGHLAAAGLIRHSSLEQKGYVFGPEYQQVDQQVICRRNAGEIPRNVGQLVGRKLALVAGSPGELRLLELQQEYPDLSWESVEDTRADELLEQVWRREIDCTIANSSALNIKRRIYPELKAAFTISEDQSLAWMLSPEWAVLSEAIEAWLDYIEDNGDLEILKDRHYEPPEFDYVDLRLFIRRIKSRLPGLTPMFKRAGEKHQVPWTLLAAQAYQESHWTPLARSPTGVRGIMMLTRITAKEMKVDDRLDVEQSIMGGAQYLKIQESRLPDSVKGDDRWWYALAAYNVGIGHLRDARKLAKKFDLDPDSWLDLKGVLPLLSQKKYYKKLKFGKARGAEPVIYVQRIRNYQNILRAQLAKTRGTHNR